MNLKKALSHVFLFSTLSEKELESLSQIAYLKKLKKNENLFCENDEALVFFFIVYGKMKIFKLSPSGDERTLHIHSDGESLAEAAVFDLQKYPAHCKSLSESLVICIPRQELFRLIEKHSELSIKMLSAYSRRLREFVALIEYMSFDDIKKRLAKYILREAQVIGTKTVCQLKISKKELASLIGTTPESLSRALTELKKQNLVSENKGILQVDNLKELKQIL